MATGAAVLTDESIDEAILASEVPLLVEVGADWCPPCHAMEPVLAAISSEYRDRLHVFTVDADTELDVVARFQVVARPTLLIFHGDRLVKRLVGARSRARLVDELGDVLS